MPKKTNFMDQSINDKINRFSLHHETKNVKLKFTPNIENEFKMCLIYQYR